MTWFKYVQIGVMLMGWFEQAAEDGKITGKEIEYLAFMAGMQAGIPVTPEEVKVLMGLLAKILGKPVEFTL